jgi:hypothetical protein
LIDPITQRRKKVEIVGVPEVEERQSKHQEATIFMLDRMKISVIDSKFVTQLQSKKERKRKVEFKKTKTFAVLVLLQ